MHQHSNRHRRNGAIALFAGSLALTVAGIPSIAQAAELTAWQFDPATQQLQVTVPAGTTPRYFLLARPARIVLDLPNTQVGNVTPQQNFGGAVRQIRVSQFDPTSTRIVIELSPDAELAPGQVELQQASSGNRSQWVLRPLLVNSAIAAQPAPRPTAPVAASPIAPPASPPATLPPLEPNAIEIPIAPAVPAVPPAQPGVVASNGVGQFEAQVTATRPAEIIVMPPNTAPATTTLNVAPLQSVRLPPRAAEPDLPARDPIMMPPAIDSPPPISVQVPPIAPPAVPSTVAAAPVPIELPPALPATVAPAQVSVPPLSPATPVSRPAAPAENVEFGQPLVTARRSAILLPAGTVLNLRYPREAAIEIESGRPRQEVLLLQTPIRNDAGATILPAGTQVIGRFEVDRAGGRFVAQAVSIDGRNIRVNGESVAAGGDHDSSEDLLVHSALGALALTLVGGFSGLGLIGGAAAGAATTYLAPPGTVVIQPNQMFEVRLTEDVPQPLP